jgi:hypothetical protein
MQEAEMKEFHMLRYAPHHRECLSTDTSVGDNDLDPQYKHHNPRRQYLCELGLTAAVDPFLSPVAEQEMDRAKNIEHFFAYYTPPDAMPSGKLSTNTLRKAQHSFVYGKPGDGKTMLRFALEASCRVQPDKTLVVNLLFNEDLTQPLSTIEHGNRLIQAFAADLVLQVIEQAGQQLRSDDLWMDDLRTAAIARQIRWGGSKLLRFLRSIFAEHDKSSENVDVSSYWKLLSRYPVQSVSLSGPMYRMLKRAIEISSSVAEAPTGFDGFYEGVNDANMLGFQQVFIIIDGVDKRLRKKSDMYELIKPLLERISPDTSRRVYYKLFLPSEIKDIADDWCKKNIPPGLYTNCLNATINWTHSTLQQLLIQRFRASGSRVLSSLDDLADPSLKLGLEQPLLNKSDGSPRKLLQLVSDLIQAHAERAPDQLKISLSDFQKIEPAV